MFFCCDRVDAFLIYVHRNITEEALMPFSEGQIPQSEKRQIVQGCTYTDVTEGGFPFTESHYDDRFHFDNRQSYAAVVANYRELVGLLDLSLAKKSRKPYEFGKILHAAEDFYSHSNYVLVYTEYLLEHGNPMRGDIPPLEEVLSNPKQYQSFIAKLKIDLHTGIYPTPKMQVFTSARDHGNLTDIRAGMNKDWFMRPHYEEANHAAYEAALWYLRLYINDKDARRDYAVFKSSLASTKD
jgi:hypothetical protein